MDYNFEKPVRKNYAKYPETTYQQPATATASYAHDWNNDQKQPYIPETVPYSGYDSNYTQESATNEAYQEQNYEAEPSLSDYNSHECCVRVSTKKYVLFFIIFE